MQVVGRIINSTTTKAHAEVTDKVKIGDAVLVQNNGERVIARAVSLTNSPAQGFIAVLEFDKPLARPPRLFSQIYLQKATVKVPTKVSLRLGCDGEGGPVWTRINSLFSHLLIGGLSFEGKTNLGLVLAEELSERQVPTLIIDSQGEFLGLASVQKESVVIYDDKIDALTVLKALAMRKCAIVNLLGLSNGEKAEAVAGLLKEIRAAKETDYQRSNNHMYPPIVIIIDEVEIYAPMGKRFRTEETVKGSRAVISDLVKRMGKFGLGLVLIAQRLPALDPDTRSTGSCAFFRLTDAGSLGIAKNLTHISDADVKSIRNLTRGQCIIAGKAVPYRVVAMIKKAKSPRTKSLDFEEELGLDETEREEIEIETEVKFPLSQLRALQSKESRGKLDELAQELDVRPEKLLSELETLLQKGGDIFGPKRLELYEVDNSLYARVWQGKKCTYSSTLFIVLTKAIG
jgi:hypothetical protein